MKLLVEQVEGVEYLTEEKNGQKSLYIHGVFMMAETVNKNNRIYSKRIMEGAVNDYIKNKIETRTSYGELTHPSTPNINPDRVCHLVESLTWDKNDVIGKAKIGGPMGPSVAALINLGGAVGVSSRGLGSIKENNRGILEVQDDFRLAAAADVVLDPSAPSAYVKGIMESVDYFYDIVAGMWTPSGSKLVAEEIEDTRKKIHRMSKSELEERYQGLLENYLEMIFRSSIKNTKNR